MRVISIGNACNIKYQIDNYFDKGETLFFDWLMIDIDSVIKVLSCKSIEDILNFNTVIVDPVTPVVESNSRILIKSLQQCISIHDVPINPSDRDISDFIAKYKRRYTRIINYINSDEKLYFIKHGYIDEVSKKLFIQTVQNINKNCEFKLVVIKDSQPRYKVIYSKNIVEIHVTTDRPLVSDWTTDWLDWKSFFDIITKSL